MALKISKSTWMKIGIVVAVALIIFFIYRAKRGRSGYAMAGSSTQAQWIPDTPAMPMTLPDDDEDYAADDDDDMAYADAGVDVDASGSMLMQSTMDDDDADAEFDPY